MTTRIFGSGIRRREDPRLITGGSTYTDDVTLPGMVHAAILRSPHAHARITGIDTAAAAQLRASLRSTPARTPRGRWLPSPAPGFRRNPT